MLCFGETQLPKKTVFIPRLQPIARAAALLSTLAILSCTSEQESEVAELAANCTPQGGNLILDTGFTTLSAHRSQRKWHSSEHAAGGTFKARVKNGVLSIRKIGKEPWFAVTQSADGTALAGKRLAFSAEVKLNLHEPEHPHAFGYGGGLKVLARRGGKVVVNSTIDHEPNFGVHDWQPVQVVFQLPKQVTSLRVGFVHQAGGKIKVRNPALHVVHRDCPVTVGGEAANQPGRPSDLGELSTGK